MWNHELQPASASSKEWNARHWMVTIRIKAKPPNPLRPDTQSQSLQKMNQQKDLRQY